MSDYADVEIGLFKREGEDYKVEFRFSQPGSDADVRLMKGEPEPLQFNLEVLRRLKPNSEEYAQEIGKSLWQEPLLTAFRLARANAKSLDAPLRLRLFIDPSAEVLHELHWETLRDPDDQNVPLFANEGLLFSRYLSSDDLRPIDMRPMRDQKALIVIANPHDLPAALAVIDVKSELERACTCLGITPDELGKIPTKEGAIRAEALFSDPANHGVVTLNNIVNKLRDGYDILYLVCHGQLVNRLGKNMPYLYLEDEAKDKVGETKPVEAGNLASRLGELPQRPRLVVLASCQSAGDGTGVGGTLNALGPLLARVGVPAVIAMQGSIYMKTVEEFMPCFFKEMLRDGQIDRAMAVARRNVRESERSDWWMPVLFMRLKSGRVGWYNTGFGSDNEKDEFRRWDGLLSNIKNGCCTPILGPGLLESLIGPTREIARRWGEKRGFPMAPNNRDDLPQIAQYLAISQQNDQYAREELIKRFCLALITRHKNYLPDLPAAYKNDLTEEEIENLLGDLTELEAINFLNELFSAVGKSRRETDLDEPHRVFAGLKLPIYISANPDNLLTDALKEANVNAQSEVKKEPQFEFCRWSDDLAEEFAVTDYRPTPDKPLVYHPFGHLSQPESLVLTLDNYLDYLIGVSKDKTRTPNTVSSALNKSALLFLGFQIDDWSFRVLFRDIVNQEGRTLMKRYTHVAVQVDPSSGSFIDPESARTYFQDYFGVSDINVYWGSADDFAKDLRAQMQR